MKTLHKSVLIWFSPQEMYDLVVGVEHYPEFLPWCDHAQVKEQHADGVTGLHAERREAGASRVGPSPKLIEIDELLTAQHPTLIPLSR